MSTDVKTIPQGTNGHGSAPGQEKRTTADGVKLPVYMDNHATTPMDPAGAGRDAALLHGKVRQCGQPQPFLWMGG